MKDDLAKQLEDISKGLYWLGKLPEGSLISTIASKLRFYEIDDLEKLDNALIEYRDRRVVKINPSN